MSTFDIREALLKVDTLKAELFQATDPELEFEILLELIRYGQHTEVEQHLLTHHSPTIQLTFPIFIHKLQDQLESEGLTLILPTTKTLRSYVDYKVDQLLSNLTQKETDAIAQFASIGELLQDFKRELEHYRHKTLIYDNVVLVQFLIETYINNSTSSTYEKIVHFLNEMLKEIPFDYFRRLLPRMESLKCINYHTLEEVLGSVDLVRENFLILLQNLIEEESVECVSILLKIAREKGISLI